MKRQRNLSIPLMALLVFPFGAFAQSNATYDLSHNVISGGGDRSGNAIFKLEGTIGQAAAGTTSTSARYGLHGGFWNASTLVPTAAAVSITGRVNNLEGGIVRRVQIVLTDSISGEIRTAQTNTFGYYRFETLTVGRIYIVQAQSKNFQFTPDTYVFTLLDARDDLDFTAVDIR
jgi:hypothetical protein